MGRSLQLYLAYGPIITWLLLNAGLRKNEFVTSVHPVLGVSDLS